MPGLPPEAAERLNRATAGNPLALLVLAADAEDVALAPEDAPVLVPASVSRAFLRRVGTLDERTRRALVLAATSESGELSMLERAAATLTIRGVRSSFAIHCTTSEGLDCAELGRRRRSPYFSRTRLARYRR